MKCISVRQPWASLIIHHGKDIENRNWSSPYRGPLLIHASSTKRADEWWPAIELCRRRAEAATPGRFVVEHDAGGEWKVFGPQSAIARDMSEDDAVLFANARRDVLTLLAEVERLRTENAELEAANKRMWRIHEWQDAAGIIGGKRKR